MATSRLSLSPLAHRLLAPLALLALLALGACVVAPAYGPAPYGGYYAPSYAYAPVVVGGGWYGGGGGGWYRGGRGW